VSYLPAPRRQAPLPDSITEPPDEIGMGETGRDLYAATPALARLDPDHSFAWAKYLAALSELLDVIAEMVRDDAEGNPGSRARAAAPSRSSACSPSGPGSAAGTRSTRPTSER
jgi:hypothetical protein